MCKQFINKYHTAYKKLCRDSYYMSATNLLRSLRDRYALATWPLHNRYILATHSHSLGADN